MAESNLPAGPGTRVTLEFALKLVDGELVDRTPAGSRASFDWGDGKLPEAFQARIAGLAAGDYRRFEVPAAEAFGPWREDNLQRQPREQFRPEVQLEPGTVVQFQDASGASLAGVVRGSCQRWVEVDFNHPLAGRDLVFEVEVHAVEPLGTAAEAGFA